MPADATRYRNLGIGQSVVFEGYEVKVRIDDFFGAVAGDNLVSNAAFSLTAREGGLFVNATSGTLKDGSEGSMLRVVKGAASYFKRPAAKEMALRLAGDKIVTVSRSKNGASALVD